MNRSFASTLAGMFLAAAPTMADQLVGTWATGPDQKGQTAHIGVRPCGAELCGTVLRSFDKTGNLIRGPNDGKKVIWGMKPVVGGQYDGKLLLPLYKATVNGHLVVKGAALTVKGCLGAVCKSQRWTRLN